MTPPIAWLPYSVDCAPRRISIRPVPAASRLSKNTPPAVDHGSVSWTPSISRTVSSLPAPRMNTEVSWPTPPLRWKLTPGTVASRSAIAVCWLSRIVAASITVIELPIRLMGTGLRVAVTTISSSAVSVSAATEETIDTVESTTPAVAQVMRV